MTSPVTVLDLGSVTLPSWHPRHADGTCYISGFVIHHPDGSILIDTGCADDNEIINKMYTPDVVPIIVALNDARVDERDIVAIVNTHLHFDHCGQNRSLPDVPVWVQAAEVEVASEDFYTVPKWASVGDDRLRKISGDERIADGVTILATPGHTPGHQSVLVELAGGRDLIVGQACYTCAEFESGAAREEDMHDESWLAAGVASLVRLRALEADNSYFSHDPHFASSQGR